MKHVNRHEIVAILLIIAIADLVFLLIYLTKPFDYQWTSDSINGVENYVVDSFKTEIIKKECIASERDTLYSFFIGDKGFIVSKMASLSNIPFNDIRLINDKKLKQFPHLFFYQEISFDNMGTEFKINLSFREKDKLIFELNNADNNFHIQSGRNFIYTETKPGDMSIKAKGGREKSRITFKSPSSPIEILIYKDDKAVYLVISNKTKDNLKLTDYFSWPYES